MIAFALYEHKSESWRPTPISRGISMGGPGLESNLGLPYSKPTHNYLSYIAHQLVSFYEAYKIYKITVSQSTIRTDVHIFVRNSMYHRTLYNVKMYIKARIY
jgi:hypothetical protein